MSNKKQKVDEIFMLQLVSFSGGNDNTDLLSYKFTINIDIILYKTSISIN